MMAGGSGKFLGDVNVTPFVDVMLVLLIIFMATAPMMTQGLQVDLPQTRRGEEKCERGNPFAKGSPLSRSPLPKLYIRIIFIYLILFY